MTLIDLGERPHGAEPEPHLAAPPRPVGRPLRAALVALLTLLSLGAAAPGPQRLSRTAVSTVPAPHFLIVGDLLVLADTEGPGSNPPHRLTAVGLEDGRTRWRLPLPPGGLSQFDRVGDDVVVTVESDGGQVSLMVDGSGGRVRWRQAGSAVPIDEDGLLLTDIDPQRSTVHRVVADSGAVRWSATFGPGPVQYLYRTDGAAVDALVALDQSGRVEVRDIATGASRAQFRVPPAEGDGYQAAQVAGDLLLVDQGTERLGGYGLDDGKLRWQTSLNPEAPFVYGCGVGLVCLGSPDGSRVLDLATGRLRWTTDEWMPALPVGGRLLAFRPGGERAGLALLDPATGRVRVDLGRWQVVGAPLGEPLLLIRTVAGDRVLLAELDPATGEVKIGDVLSGRWEQCVHRDRSLVCWREGGELAVWRRAR